MNNPTKNDLFQDTKPDMTKRSHPMKTLTIYDPPMCCSTGICGAEIDQKLVDFAADLDWLKSLGVDVKRINLSQEPTLFAKNERVKSVLETSGVEGLPVIIAGDVLQSSGQYPSRDKLAEMAGVALAQSTNGAKNKAESSGCCSGNRAETAKAATEGCCGGTGDANEEVSGCC